MDPDEVDSGSDDDDADNNDNSPKNMPSPNVSPNVPSIPPSNMPQKSQSKTIPKSKQMPHPNYKSSKYKFNTRLAKRQRANIQYQQNLQKQLIQNPDLKHIII